MLCVNARKSQEKATLKYRKCPEIVKDPLKEPACLLQISSAKKIKSFSDLSFTSSFFSKLLVLSWEVNSAFAVLC